MICGKSKSISVVTPVTSKPCTSTVSKVKRSGRTSDASAALDIQVRADARLEMSIDIIEICPFYDGGNYSNREEESCNNGRNTGAHNVFGKLEAITGALCAANIPWLLSE